MPNTSSVQKNTAGNKRQHAKGIYADLEALIGVRSSARLINFRAGVRSSATMDGSYLSNARGRGMEFAEVRPYQAGDDIRTIDWRVTARTQSTYTKLFQEEKERPVYLLVDQRSSMFFGSRRQFKSHLTALLASVLAWGAFDNGDSLGAIVFNDETQENLRPKRGKKATLRFLNALADFNLKLNADFSRPSLAKTSAAETSPAETGHPATLGDLLLEFRRITRPGSLIYVISDFHDIDQQCEQNLSMLSRHCDVELLHIYDPLETSLPAKVRLNISDGLQRCLIDTRDAATQRDYENEWQTFNASLAAQAMRARARLNHLSTAVALDQHLGTLFQNARTRGRF